MSEAEDMLARCISQFRQNNPGEVSKSLINNFQISPSQQLEKSRSQVFRDRITRIKNRNIEETAAKKGTFITGLNLELEQNEPNQQSASQEISYDDMIKNIDGLRTGFLDGYDNLELLRRRIERCEKGIREHARSTKQLEGQIKDLQRGKSSQAGMKRNTSNLQMNKVTVRAAHHILAKR